MRRLIHRALARSFVRTPAKKLCAVPEPAAREMVVGNFHNCFGSDWFPFASAIGARMFQQLISLGKIKVVDDVDQKQANLCLFAALPCRSTFFSGIGFSPEIGTVAGSRLL
jgi:hypothetical protein